MLHKLSFIFEGPPGRELPRLLQADCQDGACVVEQEWEDAGNGNWKLRVQIDTANAEKAPS